MKFTSIYRLHYFAVLLLLFSCTVDNVEDQNNNPKTDFSSYNYVLATEDAGTADITRFFSFNLSEVDPTVNYDLIDENTKFINSDPSTSSGHHYFDNFIFSMALDKKGYSSTPGLYRLTQNTENRMFIDSEIFVGKDNIYPARKLCIIDKYKGFFYDEAVGGQLIQMFNPTTMQLLGQIDLYPHIKEFRPDANFKDAYGNNLVRTGSLALDYKEDKLYVSVVFLEELGFNLISEDEEYFYLAVIDIPSFTFEKIIQYHGTKTVSFYVSENHSTTKDEDGNLYFASWGWNQFNTQDPSQVFRIKAGETDFDTEWKIDIEGLFGKDRIVQSIMSFNNKLYLQVSDEPYSYSESDQTAIINGLKMYFYEFDPVTPNEYRKLDIPSSNPSPRVNVFNVIDDKLFIAVANAQQNKTNGLYSVDRNGELKKEMQIENKYRPTRFYKLEN